MYVCVYVSLKNRGLGIFHNRQRDRGLLSPLAFCFSADFLLSKEERKEGYHKPIKQTVSQ